MANKNRKTILIILIVAFTMFSFTFAIVPFYNAICRITGINTSQPILFKAEARTLVAPDLNREVTVQFVTTNNQNLPWDFYPLKPSVALHLDENIKVLFYAKNKTNHLMIVQAIPSMTPSDAVAHFHKIECFCFHKQTLKAGESIAMPVVFRIDRTLPSAVNTITLAYTLFEVTS